MPQAERRVEEYLAQGLSEREAWCLELEAMNMNVLRFFFTT